MYWLAGLCIGWLDCIGCIGWMDCIVSLYRCIAGYFWISLELDCIGWIPLDNNEWNRTHRYCKDGMDGTDGNDGNDGLDGALVT